MAWTSESKPAEAMPRYARPPASATSTARSRPSARTSQARRGPRRCRACARSRCRARRGGRRGRPSVPRSSPATAPEQAVAAHRRRHLAALASAARASSRAWASESVRSTRKATPARAQRRLDPRQQRAPRGRRRRSGLTMRQTAHQPGRTLQASTSAASESATFVGAGRPPRPPRGSRAGEHERAVDARAPRARDVGVEAVADRQRAPGAEAVAGGLVHARLGLADDAVGAAPGGRLDRGQHGARARPRAVGHRERRVAPDADQLGAAQHGLGGDPQLAVVEVVVPADDHDVRARGELGVVDDPQPGVGDVVDQRRGADDERRAALRRPASTYCSAAPQVTTSSTHAWKPSRHSLRTNSSGACAASLVRKAIRFPAPAGRRPRRPRRRRAVADPQAAVEVEQHVVVARDGGGQGHGPHYHRRPCRGPVLSVLLACLALSPPAATTTSGRARPPRPRRRGHRRGAGDAAASRRPARAQGRELQARPARPGQDLRRHDGDHLRRVRDHARRGARPQDRRLVQVPRRRGLLRRPDVPPHRPRLRHPGRRPAGQRPGRARLLGRRGAAGRPRLHEGRRGHGQDRSSRRPGPRAASSSS